MSDIINKLKKRSSKLMLSMRKEMRVNKKTFMEDHFYHYTDASKYADKYYGEVYRQTTKHDNEWD